MCCAVYGCCLLHNRCQLYYSIDISTNVCRVFAASKTILWFSFYLCGIALATAVHRRKSEREKRHSAFCRNGSDKNSIEIDRRSCCIFVMCVAAAVDVGSSTLISQRIVKPLDLSMLCKHIHIIWCDLFQLFVVVVVMHVK